MSDTRIYEPQVRLQSHFNGPLRGGEMYQVGFYDAGMLRAALNSIGMEGNYEIVTLKIPNDDAEFEQAIEMLNHPDLQYALVDKNKLVYCFIYGLDDNQRGWLKFMNSLGYQVNSGPKTNKRLKSFHRPTLLNAHFEHLNIVYVEPHEFSKYDFTNSTPGECVASKYCEPEIIERLLDGGFVISRRIIEEAVKNIPMFENAETLDEHDYYFDPRVRSHTIQDLLNAPVFNARFIFEDGFLKGNCFVTDLPEGIDIITFKGNVKSEISYHRGFQFQAEPQGPKSRVLTDDQTMINVPQLFDPDQMKIWLEEEYKKMFDDAVNNRILTNWKYIYQRMWRDNEDINDNEARARMAYVGYRWTAGGMKLTESPWLFETIAISHAKPLQEDIPIPCSVYEQIVPESLIRMAGHDIEVEEGTIVRYAPFGVHVVDDLDWLEMYESHGGHDQDDFFKLFYRTMNGGDFDGEKVVIAIRSPNGLGEYTIFRYVENEWSPTWHMADGTEVKFPHVNGDNWPTRLSSAIFANEITYQNLPSTHQPKEKRTGPYTQNDFIRDIRIAMSGGNVGGFVNSCMLHASVIAQHRPNQLCSLEDAIDKCINPDSIEDVTAIDKEAKTMLKEVLNSNLPIDKVLWNTRGPKNYKEEDTLEFYDGVLTQMYRLCMQMNNDYVAKIKEWSQENARPRDIVYSLGRRMSHWTLGDLNGFRSNIYRTNSSEQTVSNGHIERSSWENLYLSISEKINKFERVQDKYDYILGLYCAALMKPTSGGRISDQIVMNRFVFPYLEAALQYYGVMSIPMYDNRFNRVQIRVLKNDEWYWPDASGNLERFTTPLDFQKAHSADSPIDFRMPKSDTPTPTQSIM